MFRIMKKYVRDIFIKIRAKEKSLKIQKLDLILKRSGPEIPKNKLGCVSGLGAEKPPYKRGVFRYFEKNKFSQVKFITTFENHNF